MSENKVIEKSCIMTLYSHSVVEDCKLVSLKHKLLTVALVIFYYSIVE